MTREELEAWQAWFDVEVGHSICPSDETDENCKGQQLVQLIDKYTAEKVLEGKIEEILGLFVVGEDDKVLGLIDNSLREIDKRLRYLQAELAQLKEEE